MGCRGLKTEVAGCFFGVIVLALDSARTEKQRAIIGEGFRGNGLGLRVGLRRMPQLKACTVGEARGFGAGAPMRTAI